MNDFNKVVTGLEDFGGEKENLLSLEIEKTIDEVSRMLYDREHSLEEGASEHGISIGLHREAEMRRKSREEIRKIAKEFEDKYHKGPTTGQLLAAVERAKRG